MRRPPPRRHRVTLALFAAASACLALAGVARAADVDIRFDTVVKGKAHPALIVTPDDAVKSVTIQLTDSAERKQSLKAGAIRAGKAQRIEFKHGDGTNHYSAHVVVKWARGGVSYYEVEFDATRVQKLELRIAAEDVDLDEHRLTCRATNPIIEARLTILGESGKVLDEIISPFDPPIPTGDPIPVAWSPPDGQVVRMDLRVTDVAGFYTGVQISPFSIEIPHEEVIFEFGKADVRPSEEPKLVGTLAEIKKALETHGTLLTLKLFVAGYTDSVGSKSSNLELSNRRARAIAAWFRGKGLKIPIFYQGFGEEAQAVPTPDETEEARNRRALYILSSQVPTGESVPSRSWKPL